MSCLLDFVGELVEGDLAEHDPNFKRKIGTGQHHRRSVPYIL